MCTVTYLPLPNQDFILTHNRDEQASRSPENITILDHQQPSLIFPRDRNAGGTWIALADDQRMICILNGAFQKHQHRPPYRRSRGLMALDFFYFKNAEHFFRSYTFEGMEAFTIIVWERGRLFDFRWDGKHTHLEALNPNHNHIWASAPLYNESAQLKRKQWFDLWLADHPTYSASEIMDFHLNAGEGDPAYNLVMTRYEGLVQTVSITQIQKSGTDIKMDYLNLVKQDAPVKTASLVF